MARQVALRTVSLFLAVGVIGIFFSQQAAAQSATFQRGEQVRIKAPTKPSDPKSSDMVLTVVAVGGDRIRLAGSMVYVNDTAIGGFSQDFLVRVVGNPKQTPDTVPAGHYFVMGEARTSGGNVSEYWGQHAVTSLEAAR